MDTEDINIKNLIQGNQKYSWEDFPLSCLMELADELIEDPTGLYWTVNRETRMNPYNHFYRLMELVYPRDCIFHFLINDYSSWSPWQEFSFFQKHFNVDKQDFEECSILAYSFFKMLERNHANYRKYFHKNLDEASSIPFEKRVCFNLAFIVSFATLSMPYAFVLINPKTYVSKSSYDAFLFLVNGLNNIGNRIYLVHIGTSDVTMKKETGSAANRSTPL